LGLKIASWHYGLAVSLRNAFFDWGWRRVIRVPVPVVSIGNLTLGGTGKTPCVEYVAQFYRQLGVQVAILSRGYGSEVGRNDEALVLEDNLPDVPHLQDPDRVAVALRAIEELESELLVLDDGFQHRRLHRDLDIVLVDSTRSPLNEALFPRGTLRESLKGLRRANVIVLTRCNQARPDELNELSKWLDQQLPGILVAMTEHRPSGLIGGHEPEPIEKLRGVKVAAFCGIGNPSAFHLTLEQLGAKVVSFRTFPDHHPYSRADVQDLAEWAAPLPLVTTQKDWVKLRVSELRGREVRALRIGLSFQHGKDYFDQLLQDVLQRVTC
jgi:tetraacyldisaccharide 4'-kinase